MFTFREQTANATTRNEEHIDWSCVANGWEGNGMKAKKRIFGGFLFALSHVKFMQYTPYALYIFNRRCLMFTCSGPFIIILVVCVFCVSPHFHRSCIILCFCSRILQYYHINSNQMVPGVDGILKFIWLNCVDLYAVCNFVICFHFVESTQN